MIRGSGGMVEWFGVLIGGVRNVDKEVCIN